MSTRPIRGPALDDPIKPSRANVARRMIADHIVSGLAILATILVLAPLAAILFICSTKAHLP